MKLTLLSKISFITSLRILFRHLSFEAGEKGYSERIQKFSECVSVHALGVVRCVVVIWVVIF